MGKKHIIKPFEVVVFKTFALILISLQKSNIKFVLVQNLHVSGTITCQNNIWSKFCYLITGIFNIAWQRKTYLKFPNAMSLTNDNINIEVMSVRHETCKCYQLGKAHFFFLSNSNHLLYN